MHEEAVGQPGIRNPWRVGTPYVLGALQPAQPQGATRGRAGQWGAQRRESSRSD